MPKIYLAGPMAGQHENNFPAFFEYAEALEDGGWEVFNPAANDIHLFGSKEASERAFEEDKQAFMRIALGSDLAWICKEADAIAMMPGWERSFGARAEHATAVSLKLQIVYLNDDAII